MKLLRITYLSLLIFVAGCVNEPDESNMPRLDKTEYVAAATFVSEQRAMQEVLDLLALIDGPTRGGTLRRITESHTVGGFGSTRSSEETPDSPLYYIFNFENDEGFALATGDIRVPPVLCITENGNLRPEDFDPYNPIDHPGLRIMFSDYDTSYRLAVGLPVYNFDTEEWETVPIEEPELPESPTGDSEEGSTRDPITLPPDIGVLPSTGTVTYRYTSWTTQETAGTRIAALWGQGPPYNNEGPLLSNGDRAVAGCGATAIAIIMYHYGQPALYRHYQEHGQTSSYMHYYFDWTEMRKHTQTYDPVRPYLCRGVDYSPAYPLISKLFECLNLSSNLDADYGASTSVSTSNISKAFTNFGYASGGNVEDFNFTGMKPQDQSRKALPAIRLR